MAKFGSPFAAGFGSPQNHISELSVIPRNGGASLGISFIPTSGYGNAWFAIYVNAINKSYVLAVDGQWTAEIRVPAAGSGKQSVTVLRIGHASSYDLTRIVRYLEAPSVGKVTLNWTWNTDQINPAINSDGSDEVVMTNFVMNGVNIDNLAKSNRLTRRFLSVNNTVTGGNAFIEIIIGGDVVANGTVAYPGTCVLTEVNGSGISGTVDVSAAAVTDYDTQLYFRRPEYVKIKRGLSDPPTAVVATIPYSGNSSDSWTEPTALAAGTYYYRIQSVSDTGVSGDETATLTAVVPGPPEAPSNLTYASGNAPNTVLAYTCSTTTGATYRLYLRAIGADFFDLKNIAATAIAGSTTITVPPVAGYPGTVQALVRAVNGIVEEQNLNYISLEYDDAGAKINPRPNDPLMSLVNVSSGKTINFTGLYDPTDELGVGTSLQLFSRTPNGSYDFTAPEATFTLVAGTKKPLKSADITNTYGSNGYRYITIKAVTALGTQSTDYATEQLVFLTDASQSAPSLPAITISRG